MLRKAETPRETKAEEEEEELDRAHSVLFSWLEKLGFISDILIV